MIFKLRKTKRKEMIIYIGSGHMTGGCVTVRDRAVAIRLDSMGKGGEGVQGQWDL